MSKYIVILFYKFIHIENPEALAQSHREMCEKIGINGRMIIASEGINGTFEGTLEQIEEYKKFMKSDARFADMSIKESRGNGNAFPKTKIKVRDEIVTLKAGTFNVKVETAPTITAEQLEKMYENNEDFVVLDLRNDYEIASGKFERTIDPGLSNFRDLGEKISQLEHLKDKKVIAVCTGDVRCEKGTCLLKKEGFKNLYHLEDGIHSYMQKYPGKNFKGTLFVFDNRMTTDVVDIPEKEVIGRCIFCNTTTERYYAMDNVRPSKKVISCEHCYIKNKSILREVLPIA